MTNDQTFYGWALLEYAKTDSHVIRQLLDEEGGNFSNQRQEYSKSFGLAKVMTAGLEKVTSVRRQRRWTY